MSKFDWWRSHHGAPTDVKWLLIAKRAGVSAGMVSAVVWALLDHASQAENRGDVSEFDVETYAIFSGFSEDAVHLIIYALADKGVIKDQRFAKWDKRQPQREDDSTERTRAYRARKADAKCRGGKSSDAFASMPYDEYLQTEQWQEKRKAALAAAGYRCQVCNADDRELHVHHRTYERRGNEVPDDLTVLCCECHQLFHEESELSSERQ